MGRFLQVPYQYCDTYDAENDDVGPEIGEIQRP